MANKSKKKHLVIFQPSGCRGYIEEGKTIKEASRELGVDLESICGGQATCGKCRVRIEEGCFERYGIDSRREHLSPMEERESKYLAEHLDAGGYRLACVAKIHGDIMVFVPEESRADRTIVRKAATERAIKLKPAVRQYYAELAPATLAEPLADWERLQAELERRFGLHDLTIDYHALLSLQRAIRRGDWQVTASVWMDKEVIRVEPGLAEEAYGLAVDIGTTTVAGYLRNLTNGDLVAIDAMINPQVTYGEDVMSRITYATANKDGLRKMQRAIVSGLNQIVRQVTALAGIKRRDIIDMVVVGNSCMHHIFLGIHPEHLGRAPFSPALHHSLDVKARELGLRISDGAYVHVLPIEAGFIGADNAGVLIAEEPYNQDEMMLIIDIGTNSELVLGNRQKLAAASCATGPAFEGAHIKYGMRAAPGAIESVKIDPDSYEVHFKVIGGKGPSDDSESFKARGICGSGIVDAIAQMFMAGILQESGRFNTGLKTHRLRITADGPEFVIAWADETSIDRDITICQADVRAVQLAKAAIYAGARILMYKVGVKSPAKILLTGAFGNYIDRESALAIGLLPPCRLDDIYTVANSAGDGACLALLNIDKREEANRVARQVEYIELAVEPDFAREFTRALYFPHMMDKSRHLK